MRHSQSTERNLKLEDWTETHQRKSNLQFFADAAAALSRQELGNGGLMTIGLVGQRDLPGYTLRVAQSVLRWDRRPSLWSHAFLVNGKLPTEAKLARETEILEVPLHPRTGAFPLPEDNGVVRGRLGLYADSKIDANLALFATRMSDEEAQQVKRRAENFNVDRLRYNLWETLGIWQGYLWSDGARPNPLRESVPVPASSYVEMAFEALRLDLTPGATERNSAPEHLWNAAVWWHATLAELGRPISGYTVQRNKACSLVSTDE